MGITRLNCVSGQNDIYTSSGATAQKGRDHGSLMGSRLATTHLISDNAISNLNGGLTNLLHRAETKLKRCSNSLNNLVVPTGVEPVS